MSPIRFYHGSLNDRPLFIDTYIVQSRKFTHMNVECVLGASRGYVPTEERGIPHKIVVVFVHHTVGLDARVDYIRNIAGAEV